jgi:hypothetical protein
MNTSIAFLSVLVSIMLVLLGVRWLTKPPKCEHGRRMHWEPTYSKFVHSDECYRGHQR